MTLRVLRRPFALDPLMAEAKRRMRRRRVLVAALLVFVGAVTVAAVIASRSPGGPRSEVPPGGQQAQHPGASGGSSGVQAIARKWAKYFGDPHAKVVRIETVQIEQSRWTMIRLKGGSTFRAGCPSPIPIGVQSCRAHYLELGVKLNAHDASMYWGLSTSQVAAVAQARKASRRFQIFPDFMGIAVRCAISRGGAPSGTVPGTCSTDAGPANLVKNRRVEFTETWGGSNQAGWVVTLDRGGRVQSIRVTGQPPQLWK